MVARESGLPTELNILGTTFRVRVEPLGPDMAGDTAAHLRLIRIDSELAYGVQVETLYHELVHALLAHLGLSYLLTEEQEEAFAQGLGMALTYVVSTNQLPTAAAPPVYVKPNSGVASIQDEVAALYKEARETSSE